MSKLSSNAPANDGYYYSAVGPNTPDVVYGLFLCRGDVSAVACRDCVAEASKKITETCPLSKVAISWFDNCLLRYSNKYIFSGSKEDPFFFQGIKIDKQSITDVNRYSKAVMELMQDLAQAVPIQSSKMFDTKEKEVNLNAVSKLYGLQQCVPDVARTECKMCLEDAVSRLRNCCLQSRSAKMLFHSCIVWFDSQPFYNNTPPPSPLPATSSGFQGESASSQDFPSIKLDLIRIATNHFSEENKLGEGGFGPVYRGTLPDGKKIAVKRHSRNSGQGLQEFKNEVTLIARLQHTNLVRLLGCCLEENESLLIYEYMPNKSLD
ncbi:Non-specific serine/threonine protein kinase, partial [Bertholletia excelsa]